MSEQELTKMVSSCGSALEVSIKLKVVLMVSIYYLYTYKILS
jgi:hypothetical protein